MTRKYSELIKLTSFEERLEYLRLKSTIGDETFGFERYLNQSFYHSHEWKTIRRHVIIRDHGMDLGCDGYEIQGNFIIHHMNPITTTDILKATEILLNPEYLITTCHNTHNAIHYGIDIIETNPIERKPNDTCPWR